MAVNLKKQVVWAAVAIMALLIVASGVFAFSLGKYEKVKANGSVVTIPVSKLADGKARFFKFEEGGKEISFFVVKAADGGFRTAFDACDVCYRDKKGYEQSGTSMTCKNCNKRFAIDRIGPHEVGGCNPSYLPSKVSSASLLINVSDLKSGARFF